MKPYALLLLACVPAACSGRGEKAPAFDGGAGGGTGNARCSTDSQCPSGACVIGICVQRASSFSTSLAVEIAPAISGAPAALTEVTPAPSGGLWKLQTSPSIVVNAAFNLPADAPMDAKIPPSANAILSVPSQIPGRPDLTFETTVRPGITSAEIAIPKAVGARAATLDLVPLSPADQTSPPYRFTVTEAQGPIAVTLPTNNQTPHGTLLDAFNKPKTAYTARAFVDKNLVSKNLVSNVAAMKDDGRFVLSIPAAVTGVLSIELAPVSGTDPWFTFTSMMLSGPNANVGTVILPAYQAPMDPSVVFMVRGSDTNAPLTGASVRATTILDPDTSTPPPLGVTRFWQSGTTTGDGNASLSLIPGVGLTPRLYDVTVVPPPASPYASTCVPQQPILGPGDTAMIQVPRRPVLSGTVLSAQGTMLSDVTVTATRDPRLAKVPPCGGSTPTAFTTTTNQGTYRLPVDRGTYQLDYDPPAGSSAPRFSEYNVRVDDDTPHSIALPQPFLIEGDVVDADEKPLANAMIRIFEPQCPKTEGCTVAPVLRAETLTDDVGHFRAIVAIPPSN